MYMYVQDLLKRCVKLQVTVKFVLCSRNLTYSCFIVTKTYYTNSSGEPLRDQSNSIQNVMQVFYCKEFCQHSPTSRILTGFRISLQYKRQFTVKYLSQILDIYYIGTILKYIFKFSLILVDQQQQALAFEPQSKDSTGMNIRSMITIL